MTMTYLRVKGLSLAYRSRQGRVQALTDVSLELDRGGSLGLVGESGCGKTTLATALLGLLPSAAEITSGFIDLDGTNLLTLGAERKRQRRWKEISYIPQGAAVSLSPVSTLQSQFAETWNAHGGGSRAELIERAYSLFKSVELDPQLLRAFPHQLSGGMRQRAIIALALLFQPALLVADEPTTGLDVIVQRQVLDVLKRLQKERETTLIFVSHDIAVVAELCKEVAVMYAGQVMETGSTRVLLQAPRHPYTMALRRSFPDIREPNRPLTSIPGQPPSLLQAPAGCPFAARCPFAEQRCMVERPALRELNGVKVACHFAERADDMARAFQSSDVWIRAGAVQ